MTIKTMVSTHRPRVSFARFTFCWWRHNRLLMTSQWPDNCVTITWIVISNSLDIDFIHGSMHGRSCKNRDHIILCILPTDVFAFHITTTYKIVFQLSESHFVLNPFSDCLCYGSVSPVPREAVVYPVEEGYLFTESGINSQYNTRPRMGSWYHEWTTLRSWGIRGHPPSHQMLKIYS